MKRDPWTDPTAQDLGVLRFMTCGSVDDGKSTLIGRLLLDTKTLLVDTLQTLEQTSTRRGLAAPDLALLTDGLLAEREQGITIDVAYRYFATTRRNFIIADAPGHEQYTRNMVTAASTADAAVLLVDARKGLLPQTRRHAAVARLLGVRHLVLAVNKMDLVGGSREVFESLVAEFSGWLAGQSDERGGLAGSREPTFAAVPLSARDGDMVVERGERLAWYGGPTLIELLEDLEAGEAAVGHALRLPVQWVCRPTDGSARGYAGRIEAGSLRVGEEVALWPSGQRSRVTHLAIGPRELQHAQAGQSVMVSLADERDVSRGDLIVAGGPAPAGHDRFEAIACWLSTRPLVPGQALLLQHFAREVRARVEAVESVLDLQALAWQSPQGPVGLNDIVRLRLRTQQPLPVAPYRELRAAGSLILVDPATRETLAAGCVT
jgi:sulfate adenylyltransferase subunit 1